MLVFLCGFLSYIALLETGWIIISFFIFTLCIIVIVLAFKNLINGIKETRSSDGKYKGLIILWPVILMVVEATIGFFAVLLGALAMIAFAENLVTLF